MLKSDLKLDVLDMSVELRFNSEGISSKFKVGMSENISEMLIEEEAEQLNKNLDEIASIVNKAIIRDFANEIAETCDDDLSLIDFMRMVNKDSNLREALNTLMEALDTVKK